MGKLLMATPWENFSFFSLVRTAKPAFLSLEEKVSISVLFLVRLACVNALQPEASLAREHAGECRGLLVCLRSTSPPVFSPAQHSSTPMKLLPHHLAYRFFISQADSFARPICFLPSSSLLCSPTSFVVGRLAFLLPA